MTLALSAVLCASLAAAVTDLRARRIPNAIVIALLLCGLALSALHGFKSVAIDLGIVLIVLLSGTVAFSLRLIGGGDVKLLAAAAGTLGYPSCITFVLFTLVCGGVLAVAISAIRGRLGETFANVQIMALPVFAGARPIRPQQSISMPYALAVFAGAMCTAVITLWIPSLRLLP